MNVLICCLTYGNKPHDTLYNNIMAAGYPATYCSINTEGIAMALNDGIDAMKYGDFDAVGFLANDIIEPIDWLKAKVTSMQTYPNAGVIACSIHEPVREIRSQHVIGNWLISKRAVEAIGYFNEEFYPYGPIDLDYCDRLHTAGLCTYYAMNCHAHHPHSHAAGNEYGYDKAAVVQSFWNRHIENGYNYRAGIKPVYLERHYNSTLESEEYPV